MKRSLADKIEQYLKVLIDRSEKNQIEIQRSELAETFSCVPSQVTYVIGTRFTEREGYFTESRRGGKGFVRITRFELPREGSNLNELFDFLEHLASIGLLSGQEKELLDHLIINSFNQIPDEIREQIFTGIQKALDDYIKMGS